MFATVTRDVHCGRWTRVAEDCSLAAAAARWVGDVSAVCPAKVYSEGRAGFRADIWNPRPGLLIFSSSVPNEKVPTEWDRRVNTSQYNPPAPLLR